MATDVQRVYELRRCRHDLIRHRQDRSTMKHGFGLRRLKSAAFGALVLICVNVGHAQEAPAPEPVARSLPGVADIDFSLRGREAESAGTPTEGPARAAPTQSPAATTSAPPDPAAPPVRQDRPRRQDVASSQVRLTATTENEAPDPLAREAQPPESAVDNLPGSTASPELAANDSSGGERPSGLPAWPFGLAALVAAVWFAFGRRKASAPAGELRKTAEPSAADTREAEPAVAEPEPRRGPVTPPMPDTPAEAHPALRVRIAEPVPPPTEQPALPARPAIARYDAFGRPIIAQPQPPKPPPSLVAKPRARIVRYDAMGLPILD